MRLLITGASGLLGSNLVLAALDARHQVYATSHRRPLTHPNLEWKPADLTRAFEVGQLLGLWEPEWIINCAAATDVDRCEREPEWAESLNRVAARHLAQGATRSGARIIHISTDAVFDGAGSRYRLDDEPSPINLYGESKLAGERAVLTAQPGALVIRTNFYGWGPPGRISLAGWFLSRLEAGQQCPGFTDVRFCPLLANQLAELLLSLTQTDLRGCYHLVASDCLSKFEFGVRIAQAFGLDSSLVVPAEVAEARLAAPRPRNLVLDAGEIVRQLELDLPTVEQGIEHFRRLSQGGYRQRLTELVPALLPEGERE